MLQDQPLYALFAGMLSLGLFLMVAGPALRRSRVDMATRLRRLDPDSWRAELAESLPAVGFESGLRPVLRDAIRVWERMLQTLHMEGPSSLQRQLQLVAPSETPASFYLEKAKLTLIFVAFVLVVNLFLDLADIVHGPLPLLAWLAAAVLGLSSRIWRWPLDCGDGATRSWRSCPFWPTCFRPRQAPATWCSKP